MILEIKKLEQVIQTKINVNLCIHDLCKSITFSNDKQEIYSLFSVIYSHNFDKTFKNLPERESDVFIAYCQKNSDYKFVKDWGKFKQATDKEFVESLYQLVADMQADKEHISNANDNYMDDAMNNDEDIYCNMNVKLRVGGRKAPRGGRSHLTPQAIYKYLNTKLYEDNYYDMLDALISEGYYKKIHSDFKYDVDNENRGVEKTGTTKSGIDYLACWHCGDWEAEAAFFIYWDGTDIRAYEPLKGNCINTLNKSAFGNDEDLDNGYFIKEFGRPQYFKNIEINWDACLEDFESRLEVVGDAGDAEMPWEEVKQNSY